MATPAPTSTRRRRAEGDPPPVDPRNPFRLEEGLAREVALLAEEARREGSRYRPEVARYLFEAAWRPLHARLGEGDEARRALSALWELMLESVLAGGFGASSEAWRADEAYPDRAFPRLWIDVLPHAPLAAGPLANAAARLFNLFENLAPRSRLAANAVADALVASRAHLTDEGAVDRAVRAGLVAAGLLPADAGRTSPAQWRTYVTTGACAAAVPDRAMIPGSLAFSGEDELEVRCALRPSARVRVRITSGGAEVVRVEAPSPPAGGMEAGGLAAAAKGALARWLGRPGATPPGAEERAPGGARVDPRASLVATVGGTTVRVRERRLFVAPEGAPEIDAGPVSSLLPTAVAVSPSGRVAIACGLSQRVELGLLA